MPVIIDRKSLLGYFSVCINTEPLIVHYKVYIIVIAEEKRES